jgi:hypothetical protein
MNAQHTVLNEQSDAHGNFVIVAPVICELFKKWGLSQKERMALLGMTSTSMLHRFEVNPEKVSFRPDLELRMSLLLNIHRALRLLFSNPQNVYGYMKMPNHNAPFFGRTPLDMASDDFMGLVKVHDVVDGMRGGMW